MKYPAMCENLGRGPIGRNGSTGIFWSLLKKVVKSLTKVTQENFAPEVTVIVKRELSKQHGVNL
jgi:hypothetical protein